MVPVSDDSPQNNLLAVEVRLADQRDKTSWQNTFETGARIGFKNGLHFEAGYTRTGYLDIVISPTTITVPNEDQAAGVLCDDPNTCASSNFLTRDFEVDGWYATVGFQF
jgi:hypothetical protein